MAEVASPMVRERLRKVALTAGAVLDRRLNISPQ